MPKSPELPASLAVDLIKAAPVADADAANATALVAPDYQRGPVDPVGVLRNSIDAIDEAIIRLVAERAQLSARVQKTRMNAGGTRVQLGRERVIFDSYRAGLGVHGPGVADAILQVCRGPR